MDAVKRDMDRRRRFKLWVKYRRHAIRAGISTWLARHGGTLEPCGQPLAEPPRTILVSRVNKRLGNTLFVTPLIRSLADTFPGASIDVLIMDPAHRRLLAGLPGVREIICVPRSPAAWPGFARRLRQRHYDLAIDPSVNAVSNRIGISLCRARYKLGFAGPEQWVRLTHAVSVPEDEPHQARQAVYLLHAGIPGINATAHQWLELRPPPAAVDAARERLAAGRNRPGSGPEIGFFANATGEKRLAASWWREWAEAIQSSSERPRLLQIVPPGETTGLLPGITTISFEELDRLAAFVSLLDLFVAADSGPMHLAAASGTPTIGLFRATNPADYAPLGRHCLALSVHSRSASDVAECTLRHLRSLAAA
jgi:ADP-heptose:LPS heptosyltransferase